MLDIHSHILPNVDDGAKDLKESINMSKIYLDNGIDKIIATPHYIEGFESNSKDQNMEVLANLKEVLFQNGLDLDVYLGNEVYITMDLINFLQKGIVSTLNDSRYVLMEFPMFDIPLYTNNLIYELLLKGYVPIIAHPERNAKIIKDPNILYAFIKQGALAQLNISSLGGEYGDGIKAVARILLENNMIHFVGTDAHSKNKRSPNVKYGLNILKNLVDERTYERITYLNGLAVLDNRYIEIDIPIQYKKHFNLFSFLKSKFSLD